MRFNHLIPPFNNPAIRRALFGAVSQSDYMIGMVGTDPENWRDKVGYFCPNTPLANDAGMDALTAPRDPVRVKRALAEAGYAGESVVVLTPTDIASARALAEITADTLRKMGMTVEAPTMEWASLVQRRVKTDPVAQGGWNIFHTSWAALDMLNPRVMCSCAAMARRRRPAGRIVRELRLCVTTGSPRRSARATEYCPRVAASGVPGRAIHPARPVFRADRISGQPDWNPPRQSGFLERSPGVMKASCAWERFGVFPTKRAVMPTRAVDSGREQPRAPVHAELPALSGRPRSAPGTRSFLARAP